MALDKLRTFGLKQVPTADKDRTGLSWERFAYVVNKLENRQFHTDDQ